MRYALALLLYVAVASAQSEPRPDPAKNELISSALADFERHTLPIPTSLAYRVIDAGAIAGEASRCRLRPKAHHRSITRSARALGMSGTQIAFIDDLYGRSAIQQVRSRRPVCTETDQRLAAHKLRASARRGLVASET